MHSYSSIRDALTLAAAPAGAEAELRHDAILELVMAGENIRQAMRTQLARVGLTMEGFQTLAVLRQLDPAAASPTHLAQKTATTKALLSHTLTRLELSQLITRERDSTDRRIVWVRLTPLGRTTVQRALIACRKCLEQVAERIKPADLKTLLGLCQNLNDSSCRLSRA